MLIDSLLIPFEIRQVFGHGWAYSQCLSGIFNPLRIRAGVRTRSKNHWVLDLHVFNPFEIRAGVGHYLASEAAKQQVLIPLEIRAGVRTSRNSTI